MLSKCAMNEYYPNELRTSIPFNTQEQSACHVPGFWKPGTHKVALLCPLPCWRKTGTDFHGVFQQDTTDHPHGSPRRLGPHSLFMEETGRRLWSQTSLGLDPSSHFNYKMRLIIVCPLYRTSVRTEVL